jgi:hypothetical protein
MCWGFKMPAWLWSLCGSFLGLLSGIDPQKEPTYPYFSDISQGIVFLIVSLLITKVFTEGWALYEVFDIKERHGFNKMDLSLYFKDEIKSSLL